MTFLELVNHIMSRLREQTVTTLNATTFSTMITNLTKDAYKIIEDAHDWSALREEVTVNTVASEPTVIITDTPPDSMIYYAYIAGDKELYRRTTPWLARQRINGISEGSPTSYILTGTDSVTGALKATLVDTPDDVYTITFDVCKRGSCPLLDDDVVLLPTDPILHLALAFATRERGETGGTAAQEYLQIANLSLGQAIARDANHRPDEITLYRG